MLYVKMNRDYICDLKCYCLLFYLLFVYSPLHSQTENKKTFNFINPVFEIGVGSYDVFNLDDDFRTFPMSMIGWYLGAYFQYSKVKKRLSINLGLRFQVSGNAKINVSNEFRFNSLVIPLEVNYSLLKDRIYVISGISTNFAKNRSIQDFPVFKINTFTLNPRVGIGVNAKTFNSVKFGLEFRYFSSSQIGVFRNQRPTLRYRHHGLEIGLSIKPFRKN